MLHASVRRVSDLVHSFRQPQKSLLFLYDGPAKHWPGMGRVLYEKEPVFRATTQACCQFFLDATGYDLLPAFAGPLSADFFADGKQVTFTSLTIQLALTDLWAEKGLLPDATVGLSLGEFAAAYAAGGLTRQDAMRLCAAWELASHEEDKDYITLSIGVSLDQAQPLCRACPVGLWPTHETSADSVIVICRSADKDQATAFLNENTIDWHQPVPDPIRPLHTALLRKHHQRIREQLNQVTPLPLRRDFYSATAGKLIPKQTLIDTSVWYELMCLPILTYRTIQAALQGRQLVITHIGLPLLLTANAHKSVFSWPNNIQPVDSIDIGSVELHQFQTTTRQLKRLLRRRKQPRLIRAHRAINILPRLHLLDSNTVNNAPAVFAYLRRQHRICFLPQHKAWLLLHNEDVNYVRQRPDLFSDVPDQLVAPTLWNTKLPDYPQVRALLQPMFTPQAMADLGEYITNEVNHRLDALVVRSSFDFVDELAIPLVQSVMGHFLGLRPMESESLQATLTGHLYDMGYLADLERYFQFYLKQLPARTSNQMSDLLLEQVKTGQLSFDTAVSLMQLIWTAGTSMASIILVNLVNALVRQPHLADQLRANDALIPNFVEEGLRLDPPQPIRWRTVSQDTTLAGQPLSKGSRIMSSLLSANRDPQVFVDPDEWNLNRSAKQNMDFGGSLHHGIGASIARLEAQVALKVILNRLPNMRVVDEPPIYFASASLRGLAKLPIDPS
ncbi:cytochrome P450 [uncultured Fibrella sp.]|uniref:cytochrome P450 n=1 Tax=uncultured Fibrella sp. TaxID=1284596 RepID=UPI0035CA15DD